MDPNFITDQQWIEYRHLVSLLWLFPLLMFVFATCLLMYFAILPSLWNGRNEEIARNDPLWSRLSALAVTAHGKGPVTSGALILGALAALACLGVVFYFAQDWTRGVIEETFNRWWI